MHSDLSIEPINHSGRLHGNAAVRAFSTARAQGLACLGDAASHLAKEERWRARRRQDPCSRLENSQNLPQSVPAAEFVGRGSMFQREARIEYEPLA
jgi:hypothetical protein